MGVWFFYCPHGGTRCYRRKNGPQRQTRPGARSIGRFDTAVFMHILLSFFLNMLTDRHKRTDCRLVHIVQYRVTHPGMIFSLSVFSKTRRASTTKVVAALGKYRRDLSIDASLALCTLCSLPVVENTSFEIRPRGFCCLDIYIVIRYGTYTACSSGSDVVIMSVVARKKNQEKQGKN